ncbi:MAG TPA: FecR domain-containing protein, partial [Vicinamibacteria bacterium]
MKHPSIPALLALGAVFVLSADAVAEEFGADHGRVRHVEAGVTLQRASETFAEEATPNTPLVPGDRVWTEGAGRAEFQFPEGSLLRLDNRSKLDYLGHDRESRDEAISLRLWSGSLILHVREGRGLQFEIEV